MVGVFDRSHYEDVLIVRVHDLVPKTTWQRRYAAINRFEQTLARRGTTVVKVMLHISPDEQQDRLLERLDRPDKHWKYDPADVDQRMHWDAYAQAYQAVLERCSTDVAPWYVVPADRKWYARWAVQQLLLEHLPSTRSGRRPTTTSTPNAPASWRPDPARCGWTRRGPGDREAWTPSR